jgi:demethylmenaquinone methyltransferase/2-methoxy-6-polyprenyl-1,4-benzoquinol methylase
MPEDIYDPHFVRSLFDEMSATYGWTNYLSSFGFCKRWRRQCVELATIKPGMQVYDLMTGMGECWNLINRQLQNTGKLVAVDISEQMCVRAREQQRLMPSLSIELMNEDVLDNPLPDHSADCIISCFGLKTFSDDQKQVVAEEISRMLRPGGSFSLLEISVPSNPMLRTPYMWYLNRCIPVTGKLLLGNPDNYRLLGTYTERFQNCRLMKQHLECAGLNAEYRELFFGCATALFGTKAS